MSPADLQEALEDAMLDVLDGSPWGPILANRIRRTSEAVLRTHGVRGRVEVAGGGQQVRVTVQQGRRVEQLVLSLSGM
jgi:hypothetical protein